jgi:uncharacterized membrane protein YhaH (DUF805 family)
MKNLFKGRLNRRNFLIGFLLYLLIAFVLVILMVLPLLGSNSNDIPSLNILVFIVIDIILLIFAYSLFIRRLHDIGKSGWYLLLVIIPVVIWFFLFWVSLKGGQKDSNKYGDKPSEKIRFPADILGR